MPEVRDSEGNVIAELPYTEEGEGIAQDMKEANPSLEIDYAPGGASDGAARSVTSYAGGGQTGYNAIGAERPMYKEGDLVITPKEKIKAKARDKYEKMHKIIEKKGEKGEEKSKKIIAKQKKRLEKKPEGMTDREYLKSKGKRVYHVWDEDEGGEERTVKESGNMARRKAMDKNIRVKLLKKKAAKLYKKAKDK